MKQRYNKIVIDKSQPIYMGVDVHKRTWSYALVHQGEVIEKMTISADFKQLMKRLKRFEGFDILSVYEAGFCGFDLHFKLKAMGVKNQITPPNKLPVIQGDRVKTDLIDSQKLALYLSKGLLKKIYIPDPKSLAMRQLLRSRRQLQRQRTQLINQTKSLLIQYGVSLPQGLNLKTQREILEMDWPNEIRFVLENQMDALNSLGQRVKDLEDKATQMVMQGCGAQDYLRLKSVPGIGSLTAATIVFEIGDWRRFDNEKQFSAYLGLTPSEYSSGESIRKGRITKQGNTEIRGLLIEASWFLIRKDESMRAVYDRVRLRSGNGKKAIVAVARKLACRILSILKNKQDYQPLKAA